MKKFTLLIAAFLLSTMIGKAQGVSTSFEPSEGYTPGQFTDQNHWLVGEEYAPLFQISDDTATDGDYSLKAQIDTSGILPPGYIVGPSRYISSYIDFDTVSTYELSFDLYIGTPSEDKESVAQARFIVFNFTGSSPVYSTELLFYQGSMVIVEIYGGSQVSAAEMPINHDNFVNIKVVYDFEESEQSYYIDGEFWYSGPMWGAQNPGVYTLKTSGDNLYYMDNIVGKVPGEDMGLDQVSTRQFIHYMQKGQLFLQSDAEMSRLTVFNLLGQQVAAQDLKGNTTSVNLSALSHGVYIAKVAVGNRIKSFKFTK